MGHGPICGRRGMGMENDRDVVGPVIALLAVGAELAEVAVLAAVIALEITR